MVHVARRAQCDSSMGLEHAWKVERVTLLCVNTSHYQAPQLHLTNMLHVSFSMDYMHPLPTNVHEQCHGTDLEFVQRTKPLPY